MPFYADLHVHSRYSRATSRDLDLERLAWWAARKGISVVGTGDCVHPAWLAEIKAKLVPEGNGLFRLKPEIEESVANTLPASCRNPVRFMLSTEISTIYKKAEKTRKVHHLVLLSDLNEADRFAASLAKAGNIASDGRPILGLDSRDLLETVLEAGPHSYLVPAHIWTPWFAALGSQSGFDSIAACYADLADHVFAVETGLSSDPAMNWRVSSLDRYRLISNSDAHSPSKLGREATRFDCSPDFFALRKALETGDGYRGTVEFFPEEGKYHLDGHRACNVCQTPKETLALDGRCPVCGKSVTVGVAHRVEKLADRDENAPPPPTAGIVESFVPLQEILSELLDCGSASGAVTQAYDRVTAALGPELSILGSTPVDDVLKVDPLLGEAIKRLRHGAVIRHAGYDGEYGVIRLFSENERASMNRGGFLFEAPLKRKKRENLTKPLGVSETGEEPQQTQTQQILNKRKGILSTLDEDQAQAAEQTEGTLIVIAGPGSGKTRMLTHRIAHLIRERGVPSTGCLAITFTRRATEELRERLSLLLGSDAKDCAIHSFHSLGLEIVRTQFSALGLPENFVIADDVRRKAALATALNINDSRAARLIKAVSVLKRTGAEGSGEERTAKDTLERLGKEQGWIDFDDLISCSVALLENDEPLASVWRKKFSYICADEFQDIDEQQYRLLMLLSGQNGNLCVIGDPDQAIYGFRGADSSCFDRLIGDCPDAKTLRLTKNYRSSETIVSAASTFIGHEASKRALRAKGTKIVLYAAPTENAEASFVAASIEEIMGGHTMLNAKKKQDALGFSDFAVLYRTDAQADALRNAFDREGIPFKKSSPALLSAHYGVSALLKAMETTEGSNLSERLSLAVQTLEKDSGTDVNALAEAKGWLFEFARNYDDEATFREALALSNEADFWDQRADRVSLLTMHASKGLEFPVVFIVGLEEGLMPLLFMDGSSKEEEEKRLFYVAMTRAKDRLYLSHAASRFGRPHTKSSFLAMLPETGLIQTKAKNLKPKTKQYSLF